MHRVRGRFGQRPRSYRSMLVVRTRQKPFLANFQVNTETTLRFHGTTPSFTAKSFSRSSRPNFQVSSFQFLDVRSFRCFVCHLITGFLFLDPVDFSRVTTIIPIAEALGICGTQKNYQRQSKKEETLPLDISGTTLPTPPTEELAQTHHQQQDLILRHRKLRNRTNNLYRQLKNVYFQNPTSCL